MSKESQPDRGHQRWAHFRFSVIGPLLAAPPLKGELQKQIEELSAKQWTHPTNGQFVRFSFSTIERWYYAARNEKLDPVHVLQRKIRSDHGLHPAMSVPLRELLVEQYRSHPSWSYQLHADNLATLVEENAQLGSTPSYTSVRRFMKAQGLFKRPRRGPAHSSGARKAEARYEAREVRSFESDYVNSLWHLDFHHGSARVLLAEGRWIYPLLLGVIDDHSRLCCHAQWYLAEGAEDLVHGLSQAFQKRGLPRALLTDNGSAMIAAETVQGLLRLGVCHETTLPYSPYQNGKQESFWNQIEGRLLPMLEGVADLSFSQLNDATLAWIEMEYNRKVHSELNGQTPRERFLNHRDVGRPCPEADQLRLAFTTEIKRTQRRSDGTVSVDGIRLEIPSRYGHFHQVSLRYASWDRSHVYLSDLKSGAILCRLYPQDKSKNAEGHRAPKAPPLPVPSTPPQSGMAPLLRKIIQQYATTGLPPAYLTKDETSTTQTSS